MDGKWSQNEAKALCAQTLESDLCQNERVLKVVLFLIQFILYFIFRLSVFVSGKHYIRRETFFHCLFVSNSDTPKTLCQTHKLSEETEEEVVGNDENTTTEIIGVERNDWQIFDTLITVSRTHIGNEMHTHTHNEKRKKKWLCTRPRLCHFFFFFHFRFLTHGVCVQCAGRLKLIYIEWLCGWRLHEYVSYGSSHTMRCSGQWQRNLFFIFGDIRRIRIE